MERTATLKVVEAVSARTGKPYRYVGVFIGTEEMTRIFLSPLEIAGLFAD